MFETSVDDLLCPTGVNSNYIEYLLTQVSLKQIKAGFHLDYPIMDVSYMMTCIDNAL